MAAPRPISTPGKCGCTGVHPSAAALPVIAAPGETGGKIRNTIRMDLISIACWRMDDTGFEFGSSFVRSDTKDDFAALAKLRDQYPGAPMSIFGHADPVGDDAFNKQLSGRRAQSIYAVLVRDTGIWETLYQAAGSAEGWGQGSITHMLTALGYNTAAGYADTVKQFQQDHALQPVDGIAGKDTRARLFAAYMDYLSPAKWAKSDFLGAGADTGGKGDYQGCGEFNPQRVFSQEEEQRFLQAEHKAERNELNAINRRVVIFLFRPGTVVTPAKWPCPRTTEGTAGCVKRQWSNGATRRSAQAGRREFGESQDTFACRFYHRLAEVSPCEGVEPRLVELIIPLEEDLDDDPYEPDRVRLRQLDGGYQSELVEGGPDVRQDGQHPLHYYHFHQVPPGLYTVEVWTHEHWHTVLDGLTVSTAGAFLGEQSVEASSTGEDMGTPEEWIVDELLEEEELDMGCC